MWTPFFEDDSRDDGLTAPSENHCSLVSLTTRRQASAFSKHVFRSVKIWSDYSFTFPEHGAYAELLVMLPEKAAASENIVTPVSEKKLRWVKNGSLTKSLTQSRKSRTTSSVIKTRSRFILNFSLDVTDPQKMGAVIFKTWNETWISLR